MSRSEQQKKYILIALNVLAEDYEEEGQKTHAQNVRNLIAMEESTPADRTGMSPEIQRRHQDRVSEAMHTGDVVEVRRAMTDYYVDVCRTEADPPAVFGHAVIEMIRNTSKEAATTIVFMVKLKLEALISDESVQGPSEVFSQLMQFLLEGIEHMQQGDSETLWADDPHLQVALANAKAAAQAQGQPQRS